MEEEEEEEEEEESTVTAPPSLPRRLVVESAGRDDHTHNHVLSQSLTESSNTTQ